MGSKRRPITEWSTEEFWWYAGLAAAGLAAIIALFVSNGWVPLEKWARPCLLRTILGWYCPGCGGTRATWYFLHGHFLKSFYYYPMVPWVLGLYVVFMGTQALEWITKRRIHGIRFRLWYVWVALILFFVGWIGKNVCLLYGVELIP